MSLYWSLKILTYIFIFVKRLPQCYSTYWIFLVMSWQYMGNCFYHSHSFYHSQYSLITTFTIQLWYKVDHTDLLIQLRYDFAKQFCQTDSPQSFAKLLWQSSSPSICFWYFALQALCFPICDSHRDDEIMQDLFKSYMTALLTQSCWAVFKYCKNANTWHFFPLFLMLIFNA